jgi:hypothetical protein
MRALRVDLTGQKFGRLRVRSLIRRDRLGNAIWKCVCICGEFTSVRVSSLRSRHTKSCGCLRREGAAKQGNKAHLRITHGCSRRSGISPEYRSWTAMLQRCSNRSHQAWKYYGGLGVKVCKRWRKFENFLADMGPRPKGTSIHRRGDEGNYVPGNCRWATRKEHAADRRRKAEG